MKNSISADRENDMNPLGRHASVDRGDTGGADIAVIGMACRFPGANNYDEYWANLAGGIDCITEVPPDRWRWQDFEGDPRTQENKSISKWGGFVADADKFDAPFFGVSPREAECMDPQQRVALELAWQCLEDAGYAPDALSGGSVGVYLGACNFDYKTLQERFSPAVQGHMSTGNVMAMIANRVSYLFNFHGPSITSDTACASSLVAIQHAVGALRSGECETALAGGVALLATPDRYIAFSKMGMLSPTGRCKAFDASADGYVRAEGAGMIYLKPLHKALADGDQVLGVIKGVATNHCGRTRSITAPSAEYQSEVITAALAQAGVGASAISYVETHGTGTPVGDPIEIAGLTRAFTGQDDAQAKSATCALGAVKTNIGHLEAAAGIAGVIKVLLAMRHRQLPPNLHFSQLNPRINLDDTPFYVLDKLRPWSALPDAQGRVAPLRASVNSFGFGGVNAHLVLEQAPVAVGDASEHLAGQCEDRARLLALSARSEAALQRMAAQYADLIEQDPSRLADLCRQTNATRAHLPYRLTTVFRSTDQLLRTLSEGAAAPLAGGLDAPAAGRKTIGFLFTGQGAQYIGMGRGLYDSQPAFRRIFDECDALFSPYLKQSLAELVFSGEAAVLNQTRFTQPALFAIEYALAGLWASFGVVPVAAMGHSIGEIVAACVAGALSLPDAVALVATRARLMQDMCPGGAMATVFAGENEVRALIERHRLPLDIAAVNAPASTVISGLPKAIEDAMRLLGQEGIDAKSLQVERAFHSHLIEPIKRAFLDHLQTTPFAQPSLRIVSNVTGEEMKVNDWCASYWVEHARKPVLFMQGMQAMRQAGVDLFIEIGPSPTLVKLARRIIGDEALLVPSLDGEQPDLDAFMQALAKVHVAGVDVRFDALHEGQITRKVSLPPYPFVGQSYWVSEARPAVQAALYSHPGRDPLVGEPIDVAGYAGTWFSRRYDVADPACAYLSGHRVHEQIILPGTTYACMAVAAVKQAHALADDSVVTVSDLQLLKPIALDAPRTVQTVLKAGVDASSRVCEVWARSSDQSADDGHAQADWVLHASGLVSWQPPQWDMVDGSASLTPNLDVVGFYRQWHKQGVGYEGLFQAIEQAEVGRDGVLADVVLPGLASGPRMAWHPALLDGIWQAVLPLLPDHVRQAGLIPLPANVAKICFKGAMPSRVRVTARRTATPQAGGRIGFDLDIHGHDGEPLGQIRALCIKPTRSLQRHNAVAGHDADVRYLQPTWQRVAQAEPEALPQSDVRGTDLIFYTEDSIGLARRLTARLNSGTVQLIGLDVQTPLPGSISVSSGDADAIESTLGQCKPVRTLYFMGGLYGTMPGLPASDQLARMQDRGPRALLRILKAIDAASAWRTDAVVKVVGNHVHAVHKHAGVMPWGAGCFGVAGVFGQENPQVKIANIDLGLCPAPSDHELDQAASAIVSEAGDGIHVAAYREGFRYLRRLTPVMLSHEVDRQPAYRTQGVYLIVGGAGGIGVALSKHLASQYQANLVWVGRSALDDTKQAHIDEIEALGGLVHYRQADALDAQALKDVVAEVMTLHGCLDGAFHSALSLQDQSVSRMDMAQFNAAYDVKVQGAWALVQALEGVQPDFVAFFSSAAALMANRGQSNYVAGCLVQDALAHHLQQAHGLRARVINWGRWGEIGAVANEAYNERLDAQGVLALHPSDGLDAIDAVLSGSAVQVAVLRADERPLAQMGADLGSRVNEVHACALPMPIQEAESGDERDAQLPHPVALQNGYTSLNRLACEIALYGLARLAEGKDLTSCRTTTDWRHALGVVDQHADGFAAMLHMFRQDEMPFGEFGAAAGYANALGAPVPTLAHLEAEKARLLSTTPWLAHEIGLLWACGMALPGILKGEIAATSVIFPDMSMAMVEGIYRESPLAKASNRQVARRIAAAVGEWARREPDSPLRILEIGAGTGGTTAGVLAELDKIAPESLARLEYVYTDISPAFLNRGKALFAQGRPYLHFALLDIEQPMADQGQLAGSVDIVMASNVLHATRDLSRTLQHVKYLLKRGGTLVLNEVMRSQGFLTMTFGLLDGWWLAQDRDKRLPHSPLLSESLWGVMMADEGMADVSCRIAGVAQEWCQGVLTASSDGRYVEAVSHQPASKMASRTGQQAAPVAAAVSADDVVALFADAAPTHPQGLVLQYLRGQLAQVLQLHDEQFDKTGRPLTDLFLSELGVDSLTAMDLRGRLRAQLGVNAPVEVLLGGTRIAGVVELICDQLMVRWLMARRDEQVEPDAQGGAQDMESFTL